MSMARAGSKPTGTTIDVFKEGLSRMKATFHVQFREAQSGQPFQVRPLSTRTYADLRATN